MSQWPAGEQEATTRAVKDAYNKHTIAIRGILPPYSGPPLLLDLFQKSLEEGMCDPQQHVAWESEFNGSMGTSLADPGFSKAADSTATTMVTIDTFAPVYSLPAKLSSAVVIAKPIAGKVCIPQNRKFVYTKFTLSVLKRFKPARDKRQLQEKAHITAASFGGSIRFPSGYLETFLWSQAGFIEIGKEYVLFMWKPVASDDLLVISQAYLIQDGFVFPVSTNGDAQKYYTKLPFPEFEAQVDAAVAKNVDTNGLANPRASR